MISSESAFFFPREERNLTSTVGRVALLCRATSASRQLPSHIPFSVRSFDSDYSRANFFHHSNFSNQTVPAGHSGFDENYRIAVSGILKSQMFFESVTEKDSVFHIGVSEKMPDEPSKHLAVGGIRVSGGTRDHLFIVPPKHHNQVANFVFKDEEQNFESGPREQTVDPKGSNFGCSLGRDASRVPKGF